MTTNELFQVIFSFTIRGKIAMNSDECLELAELLTKLITNEGKDNA